MLFNSIEYVILLGGHLGLLLVMPIVARTAVDRASVQPVFLYELEQRVRSHAIGRPVLERDNKYLEACKQ